MKLKINEEKLSIESMKKIIELIDIGVLVDTERELIEGIHKSRDLTGLKLPLSGKRKKSKRAVWTEEEERQLIMLREDGVKYNDAASQLGKTKMQVVSKIGNLKAAGRWEEESSKKPAVKTPIKNTKNPYFTKDMQNLILLLKDKKRNTAYSHIAERLNKKFGSNLTAQQVKEKYKKIKR